LAEDSWKNSKQSNRHLQIVITEVNNNTPAYTGKLLSAYHMTVGLRSLTVA